VLEFLFERFELRDGILLTQIYDVQKAKATLNVTQEFNAKTLNSDVVINPNNRINYLVLVRAFY